MLYARIEEEPGGHGGNARCGECMRKGSVGQRFEEATFGASAVGTSLSAHGHSLRRRKARGSI